MPSSVCPLEKVLRVDVEGLGDLKQLVYADVCLAVFDVAQIAFIHAGHQGESLLRYVPFRS